jgi:hypothetical protein
LLRPEGKEIMKHFTLLVVLIVAGFVSQAQNEAISVSYNHAPFTDLVRDIESKSKYRLYYTDAWIDTLKVTATFTNATPATIVEIALQNTALHYFIRNEKIILSHNVQIVDKIDSAFFDELQTEAKWNYTFQREQAPEEKDGQEENRPVTIGMAGKTKSGTALLSGYIKERKTGESIPGAIVSAPGSDKATTTDQYGFYSLILPVGPQTITVSFIGMDDVSQKVILYSEGKLNLMMDEKITVLKEVMVVSEQGQNVLNIQMGMNRIDLNAMKNVPKILGENDIFKVALALPGVKSVGEGASGLNVRGGNADQNLVTLNEATIYNPVHFLGFFSVFNADAIKSFELYKSAIPARFGGRLSSIFDIQMKDGNQKKFTGQGGIGPITSHLTFEVPLKQDKTSLMFGGRSTYSNWVLKQVPNDDIKNSNASFYDFFTRFTHNVNDKNSIYLSLYYSHDNYNLSSDSIFSYHNAVGSLQWRHLFNNEHTAVLTVSQSNYAYNLDYQTIPENSFDLGFGIKETHLKWNFSYTKNRHQIEYGVDGKLYQLDPGYLSKSSEESLIAEKEIDQEKGLENALYVSDDIELTPNLSVSVGLRYSFFAALGPDTTYLYNPGSPRNEQSIIDTVTHSANSVMKTYHGPEFRIAARYKLGDNTSVKGSYNRTRQYIHMLSNTVSVSPTNTWKLSDPDIVPQIGDQVSAGFYQDLRNKSLEFSVELYYKWLQNVIDYKTGSSLLLNENIEQDVLQGKGKAYGVEFLLRKKTGKLTGWIGYTYSRTFLQFDGNSPEEKVNGGDYFPANYDKPNDLSLVTNYKITRRYSFSLNFLYSSGRPITYPVGYYKIGNGYRINYSDRNAFRVPDYIRLDLGFNIEGSHKLKKLAHSSWTFSVYNVFGRKNPYSIYFNVEDEKIKAYKLSIFGAPIPTITYNFKF